jgi:hypothetical protein
LADSLAVTLKEPVPIHGAHYVDEHKQRQGQCLHTWRQSTPASKVLDATPAKSGWRKNIALEPNVCSSLGPKRSRSTSLPLHERSI